MAKYQLLDIPTTQTDMIHKATLQGVITLKQGRYTSRHNKLKDIVQIPTSGYLSIKRYKSLFPTEFLPKKKIIKRPISTEKSTEPRRPNTLYKVNKSIVSNRIKQMVLQMKGQKELYFWTITFPDKSDDSTAHYLFNKWLTRCRQERLLKSYLWISERQDNGTIHFHIAIAYKMDVKRANRFMRACIMYSINDRVTNYTRDQAKNYNGVHISKDKKTGRVVNFAKQSKQKALINSSYKVCHQKQ